MRLYSTQESVKAGEITVLAIVETLLAATIAIFIANRHNTLMHIAIAASMAPFLLLRTDDSVRLGLKLFHRSDFILSSCYKWNKEVFIRGHDEEFRYMDLIRLALLTVIAAILGYIFFAVPFLIRFISILSTTITHPLTSIREIPRNWIRIVLSTDIVYPPEIFPGVELTDVPANDVIRWNDFIKHETDVYSRSLITTRALPGYNRVVPQ